MATSDLYRVQKMLTKLADECSEIESKISEHNYKILELKREYNSNKDGIKYLERIEKEIIKREERKSANLRKKNKSRRSK